MKNVCDGQSGFTLLELIAVMVILGLLAALAIPRYMDLEANAKTRAADAAVAELNGRESLTWADVKISQTGYDNTGTPPAGDGVVWGRIKTGAGAKAIDLGEGYDWTADPDQQTGGSFTFKGEVFAVSRKPSTHSTPAIWTKK